MGKAQKLGELPYKACMSHAQIDAAGALASIVPRAQRFPKRVFARLSAPEFREPVTIMDVSSSGLRLRIPARSRLDVLQECQSLDRKSVV